MTMCPCIMKASETMRRRGFRQSEADNLVGFALHGVLPNKPVAPALNRVRYVFVGS
jgi:hypothetical protein